MRALAARLQNMVEVAGIVGDLEEQVRALERRLETEASRRRETGRALNRLARVLEEALETVRAVQESEAG